MKKYPYLLAFLVFSLTTCQQGIDIPGFDEEAFRQDANGCLGVRAEMKDKLFEITSQLKGLTQTEIQNTLGTPDQQDLADRNQKFFVYDIEPSPLCKQDTVEVSSDKPPLTMYIRFSAIDLSTEVSFKNY